MKATGGVSIVLPCVFAYWGALAQSPSTPQAKPAYAVEEISSPSISISEVKGSISSIEYQKKTPAAPQRVLLGFEYSSKSNGSSKSNLLTSNNVVILNQSKGTISVAQVTAFASFLIRAGRKIEGVKEPDKETIEVRIALYEVGASADTEQNPTYGKQVSNPVAIRWTRTD